MSDYSGPVLVPIKTAVKISGLSAYRLREDVKNGLIQHTRSGKRILINIPRLLEQIDGKTGDANER